MGRKHGFSFSWKRASGISGAKGRISRKIGIPLSRSGRRRKVGRKAGCFVATVTYGDENCRQVQFLRAFRDEVLLHSHAGRIFTWLYYKMAPLPVWLIENVPVLKGWARNVLEKVIELIEAHTSIKQDTFGKDRHWDN